MRIEETRLETGLREVNFPVDMTVPDAMEIPEARITGDEPLRGIPVAEFREILERARRENRTYLMEHECKELLEGMGIATTGYFVAGSGDEAAEMAHAVGYPVAMKIVSPDILHKSDLGGVKVNLGSPNAVRDAFDLMMVRISRLAPKADLQGVYVEKMASPGLEVILGVSRDPHFGPMLMFGLGGIFVEVMKDVTFHLAPITAEEALQMLENTKSYALLKGARGRSGVDIQAIATSLQRISQLVTDFPQIAELDINPFIVGRVGEESVVADARMSLSRIE